MKEALKFLGVTALALVIGFTLITCSDPDVGSENPGEKGHTHEWSEWLIATTATCTTDGVQIRYCTASDCSDTQTQPIPALGHLAPNEIPATCTEAGNTGTGTCIRPDCDETITGTVIPALGHSFGSWAETRTATCTVGNERTRTCTRSCGLPGNTETDSTISVLWHQNGAWHTTKEPDCLTAGDRELRCLWWDECNYIMQTEIASASLPNLGGQHIWNWETYVSGSEPRSCQRGGCFATAGVGDTGPGGGVIFYAGEFTFYQTAADTVGVPRYYLEVVINHFSSAQQWANEAHLIPGLSSSDADTTDWAIGRGYKNTLIIYAHGQANNYATPAAFVARDTSHGNYTKFDWFIPSRYELNELYKVRDIVNEACIALGGSVLGEGLLLSSTQGTHYYFGAQRFHINGYFLYRPKVEYPDELRVVRAF